MLGPSAALNRDPTPVTIIDNTSQTVPQPNVSQKSTMSQPSCLVSKSGQLQEQGFSVEVAERIAAPQSSSPKNHLQVKWVLFEKWCRENAVDFSSTSLKQVSEFFMYLYLYRTAIVDTLGPSWLHISKTSDLNRLLCSFHRDCPKSSRNLPKCTFLLYLMSSQKHALSL